MLKNKMEFLSCFFILRKQPTGDEKQKRHHNKIHQLSWANSQKNSQVRARSDKQLKTKSQGDKRKKSTRRRVNQQQHLDKNNFSAWELPLSQLASHWL